MARKRRGRLKPPSPRAAGHGVRLPVVTIVGRPNVGKSSLFNRLIGQQVSIVEATPGVTRDRIAALLELRGDRAVELVDTGGLGGSEDSLASDVERQIDIAFSLADILLFVVDGREGVTAQDGALARRLSRMGKPTLLVVNKCETAELENLAPQFWELNIGEPFPISASHGDGIEDLLDALTALIPEEVVELPSLDRDTRDMRIAIVGRRNVGKSTYVNALFGSERVLVSDLPGTTRDSVDVRVQLGDKTFTLIDTAGLRRRGRADDAIEMLAHIRARDAVARSDIALLFLDSTEKVSLVDKHLARLIAEEFKACVIVGSKWDKVGEAMSIEDYSDYLGKVLQGLRYSPVVGLSSHAELNLEGPIEAAQSLYAQARTRVNTARVNKAIRQAYDKKRPRVRRGVLPRIYFATQIATNPATIVVFVNKPSMFSQGYRRFLAGQLRAELPLSEVPIKFVFRERVNIFEAGLHQKLRKIKALDDSRYLSPDGVEESPAESEENIAEVFEILFGERPRTDFEGLRDLIDSADEDPELWQSSDDELPEGFVEDEDAVFDDADSEDDEGEAFERADLEDDSSAWGDEDDDREGDPQHPLNRGR